MGIRAKKLRPGANLRRLVSAHGRTRGQNSIGGGASKNFRNKNLACGHLKVGQCD